MNSILFIGLVFLTLSTINAQLMSKVTWDKFQPDSEIAADYVDTDDQKPFSDVADEEVSKVISKSDDGNQDNDRREREDEESQELPTEMRDCFGPLIRAMRSGRSGLKEPCDRKPNLN